MAKAILLMGPTASGKTSLALNLAKYLPVEIISVDSALIYKDMDIGTAKPTKQEQKEVRHHLIDILSPLDSYSVFSFLEQTKSLIDNIIIRGNIPLLVGGTMMYYNAVLKGVSKLPPSNPSVREELQKRYDIYGLDRLYQELVEVDMYSAIRINSHDKQRIIRALEVYYISATPMSQLQLENIYHPLQNIHFLNLSLIPSRDILHKRISLRCQSMLSQGFIEEVASLLIKYPTLNIESTSMRCVGYYQVLEYLNLGSNCYDELVSRILASTRQLAKRQITWLRSISNYNLLECVDDINSNLLESALALIKNFLKEVN